MLTCFQMSATVFERKSEIMLIYEIVSYSTDSFPLEPIFTGEQRLSQPIIRRVSCRGRSLSDNPTRLVTHEDGETDVDRLDQVCAFEVYFMIYMLYSLKYNLSFINVLQFFLLYALD